MAGRAPGDESIRRSHGQHAESQDRQCLRLGRAFFRGVTVSAGSCPLADASWVLSSAITVKAAWLFRFSVVFSSRSLVMASLSLETVACEATSCAPRELIQLG
jgi:hypothetical protein